MDQVFQTIFWHKKSIFHIVSEVIQSIPSKRNFNEQDRIRGAIQHPDTSVPAIRTTFEDRDGHDVDGGCYFSVADFFYGDGIVYRPVRLSNAVEQ